MENETKGKEWDEAESQQSYDNGKYNCPNIQVYRLYQFNEIDKSLKTNKARCYKVTR